MANTVAGVSFTITANPEQAAAALKVFQDQGIAVSSNLRKALQNLAAQSNEATAAVLANTQRIQGVLKGVGIQASGAGDAIGTIGDKAAETGKQSFQVNALSGSFQQVEQSAKNAGNGMNGVIESLHRFRRMEFVTLGLISAGFYITEWIRVAEYINDARLAMEGLDATTRKLVADMAKAPPILQALQGLTLQEQAADIRLAMTQADIREKTAEWFEKKYYEASRWTTLVHEISAAYGIVTGNIQMTIPFSLQIAAHSVGPEDVARAQHTYQTLEQSLAKVNEEIRKQNEKSGKSALHAANAYDKLAKAMQNLAAQEYKFRGAAYVEELKYGSEFTKQITKAADAIAKGKWQDFDQMLKTYAEIDKEGEKYGAQRYREGKKEYHSNLEEMMHGGKTHMQNIRDLHTALVHHTTFAGESLNPLTTSFGQFHNHLVMAGQMAGVAIEPISRLRYEITRTKMAVDQSGFSFTKMSAAMGQNAANAIVYGANFTQAMEKAMKATIASIAAQAIAHAMYETAYGFADLAIGDFAQAALHFEAAALFGAIGAATAAIGSAIPGGGGAHGGRGGGRAGHHHGEGGGLYGPQGIAGYGGSGGSRMHQTIVNVYGGQITDTHNLQNLTTALNQGGEAGTVRLNIAGSSNTLPSPIY